MCCNKVHHHILVFGILYVSTIFSKEFEKGFIKDISSRKTTSVIEVSCTIFSIFYDCSNTLNKSDDVYNRFSNVCRILSAGTKYVRSNCDKNTMSEVLTYFMGKSLPNDDGIMDWKNIQENPSSISNFVMSIMFNSKVFHRSRQKIHNAINELKHCDINLRKGTVRHKNKKNMVDDKTLLEVSCAVFTIARYCSHQFDNCNQRCHQLSIICEELSFSSKLLYMTCSKDTISELISMYRNDGISASAYNLTDAEYIYFWRDIITEDPLEFVKKMSIGVLKSHAFQLELESLKCIINDAEIRIPVQDSKTLTNGLSEPIWIKALIFGFLVNLAQRILL